MAYIIKNGDSGYTRADFVSALEAKQDVLVSGQNVKTINGQSVLGAGNIDVSAREYEYDLTVAERAVVDDVVTLLNKYNPKNEFVTFGFITDTHTTPTKAQIAQAVDINDIIRDIQAQGITLEPATEGSTIVDDIINDWPSGNQGGFYPGKTAEPMIKMLGAAAYEYGIDLVIHGGDISSGALSYNGYAYMMEKMARMFEKYISVPYFICEGNHDYKYDSNVAARVGSEWRKYLARFNNTSALQFRYVKDYENAQTFASANNVNINDFTSFSCDIDKGGLNKLRFASSSPFDNNGSWSAIARHFAFDLSDKEDIGSWSAVGVWHIQPAQFLSNYAGRFFNGTGSDVAGSNSQGYKLPLSHGGTKPKSLVGYIFGHNHDSVYSRLSYTNGYAPNIRVANSVDTPSPAPPSFSVFIFDTVNWWLYEIQAYNKRRSDGGYVEGIYENTDNLEHAWCYRYKLSHNES
jgi:hypothetical protein